MPRRKAKPQEVTEVTPAEVKQEEKPQEVKPIEAKPQELSPPPTKLVEVKEVKPVEVKPAPEPEAKEAKPTVEAKPTAPIIKSVSWEEFERFTESKREKTSWVKEAVKRAREGPVMLEGLTRGQIAALINYIDRYNESSNNPKITYKYDVKKGVVLLAPVDIKK